MVDSIDFAALIAQAGDKINEQSFEPLPVGAYNVEVSEATYEVSQNGNPMWKLKLKVVDATTKSHNNRVLFDRIVLSRSSDQALGFFFRKMGAFGLTREYFATSPNPEQVATAIRGRRAIAKVTQRMYKEEMQNEVETYKAATSSTASPPVAAPPASAGPRPPAPVSATPAGWGATPPPTPGGVSLDNPF